MMIKISFPIGINLGKVLYGTGWRDRVGIKLKTGNEIRKVKTCETVSLFSYPSLRGSFWLFLTLT